MGRGIIGWTVIVAAALCWSAADASADSGAAHLYATDETRARLGEVAFEDTPEGLRIEAKVAGVTPGLHGFHIHQFGNCGEAGNAAGPHYNPGNMPHGDFSVHVLMEAHAGDLGNIDVAPDGTGALLRVIPGLRLADGDFTVAGRSVILHEQQDDFSQPAGNAGARIGCGTIYLVDNRSS